MKKCVLLIISILLLVTACSKKDDPYDEFFDTFLLTETKDKGVTVPAIFNPAKGTTTPLCTDPLCNHSKEAGCPFAEYNLSSQLHYYKGALYFLSLGLSGYESNNIMRYDMKSGKSGLVTSIANLYEMIPDEYKNQNSSGYKFYDGYFYLTKYSDDKTSEYNLRVNLDNNKIEVVPYEYNYPISKYGKKYLFSTSEIHYTGVSYGIIISDKDDVVDNSECKTILADKRISITFTDLLDKDKLIYATAAKDENGKYDWDKMTVWMYDMKTGEDKVIIENFPSVYIAVYGDYIYYSRYVDDPPKIGYDKNRDIDKFNYSGGILYRTNIFTGEESEAFEIQEYSLDGLDIHCVGQYIIIKYCNIDYDTYTTEDTTSGIWYEYPEEDGWIVYDTTTGEVNAYKNT